MITNSLFSGRRLLGLSGLLLAATVTLLAYGVLGPGFNIGPGAGSDNAISSEDLRTGARQGFIFRESDLAATDFTLTDQHGDPVSLSQFEGQWVVMTWIYLSCKTVCPALTGEMKQLQESFRERLGRDIQLISITFDPERDTQSAMLAHARDLRADVPGWSWLTGTQAETDAIAEAYGFAYEEVDVDGLEMDSAGMRIERADGVPMEMDHKVHFDHTVLVIVIDANGDEAYRYFGIGWASNLAVRVAADIDR